MKAINFTDQELESMIEMYTAEMEEAQMYIGQIQELLKKLGAKPTKVTPVEKESKQGKKRGRKPEVKIVSTPVPTAKSVPVAANKANTKKTAAKSKVVVEKKPVAKPAPKKKAEKMVAATVESVVTSLLKKEPKKEVKKVAKPKSTEKKRIEEMAASAKLTKPVAK